MSLCGWDVEITIFKLCTNYGLFSFLHRRIPALVGREQSIVCDMNNVSLIFVVVFCSYPLNREIRN